MTMELMEGYRLSPQQRRVWLLQQSDQGQSYRLQCAILIKGNLNRETFEAALESVIDRHEILRSTFYCPPGVKIPFQLIRETNTPFVSHYDLSGLEEEEQEAEIEVLLQRGNDIPFVFENGPLFHIALAHLASQKQIVFITLPALCADVITIKNLIDEIGRSYIASLRGKTLLDEPIQYADFSEWQNELFETEDAETGIRYWLQQDLSDLRDLKLPFENRLETKQPFKPEHLALNVDPDIARKLEALAEKYATTLPTLLLGCWYILLWRRSEQAKVIVGVSSHQRKYADLEQALGLFATYIPLQTILQGNMLFEEVIEQLTVLMHEFSLWEEYFSWEEISNKDGSNEPLFCPFVFTFDDLRRNYLDDDLSFEIYKQYHYIDKFKIRLHCNYGEDLLALRLDYDASIVSDVSIKSLAEQFYTLLASILSSQTASIGDFQLSSEAERRHLLIDWNNTRIDYPEDCQFVTDLFEKQVDLTPERIAVVFKDERLTYYELNMKANQLAQHLQSIGIGPETRVALYLERSSFMLIGLLGILKAGGAYVPLDPVLPQERLVFMVKDAQPLALLTQKRSLPALSALSEYTSHVLVIDSDWDLLGREGKMNLARKVKAQDLAYVLYTSGSTGEPKGVMIQHQSFANYLNWCVRAYNVEEGQGTLIHSSLGFDLTVTSLFSPLLVGRSVEFLAEEQEIEALSNALSCGRDYSLVKITPSHLDLLSEQIAPTEVAGRTKVFVVGGEALKETQVSFWRTYAPDTRIINEYGPTEAVVGCCVYEILGRDFSSSMIPIGRPIANTELYILDARLQITPIGLSGELYIGGVQVARGYLNHPALTAERFLPHPFSKEPGARLYRTGDLARYRPDGAIEFLGRADQQVKIRGYRIELGEIEAVLSRHALVQDVVVEALQNVLSALSLVAYIVSAAGVSPSVNELRTHLAQYVPEYMIPVDFVFLDALPLTANGKVDRRALPSPSDERPELEAAFVGPRTPVEELLVGIWKQVLKVEQIGVYDNFFERGGHSLLAIQVISRVREAFQIELVPRILFADPTVAGLAQAVQAARQMDQEPVPLLQPLARPQRLPLSFAQQRLWFIDQLEPGSIVYNVPTAIRLQGRLDEQALGRSLNEVVRRHEILRTTFALVDQQPVQVIAPFLSIALPLVDLRNLDADQRSVVAEQVGHQEGQQPFQLERGPLLRVSLLRLQEQEHILLLSMHHIVSDGWSMGVLARELSALYAAFVVGEPSPLPDLPLQYADFALWQRQWLQGEILERQLAYWKQHLAGVSTLQLPTDYPRPAIQTWQGKAFPFALSPSLSQRLQILSRQEGVTLFMMLQAVLQILLARYTAQEDILISSGIADRPHSKTEDLIGCFINILLLRTDLTGNPSVREVLQRVREVNLGAYAHQDLPFERLIIEITSQRDLNYNPLLQVMIVMLNEPAARLHLPELIATPEPIDSLSTPYDIVLHFWEENDGMSGLVHYNTALYKEETIARFIGHFQHMLELVVTDPDQRLSNLPLLTQAEHQQLVVDWNDTTTAYPDALCLHELIERQADRSPDSIAVVIEGEYLTYGELDQRGRKLAHYLCTQGIHSEVSVGVCLERSLEMVVAIVGILKAGGVYAPFDPAYPVERLRFMLADVHPAIVLTQAHLCLHLAAVVPSQTILLCLDSEWDTHIAISTGFSGGNVHADNLAYIIYTSGSTGRPKGVMNTHAGIINRLNWMQATYQLTTDDCVLQKAPGSFDVSVWEFLWPLLMGARIVLARPDGHRDPAYLAHIIAEQQVTIVHFVPSMLQAFLDELALSLYHFNLRQVFCGGETLTRALQARFWSQLEGVALANQYGPTEAAIDVTVWICHAEPDQRSVPIGRPIANTSTYILNASMQPVSVGLSGELYIGGVQVARGYLNHPALTAERFLPHPFSKEPGARLYRTGDLARYRPDGAIEFLGRADQQVKIRGYRIELGEIEAVLSRHALVQDVVVEALQNVQSTASLVAYIVSAAGVSPSVNELRTHLAQYVPEYMIPAAFVFLDALPLTANGKVDRRALPSPSDERPELEAAFVGPRTPVEELLVEIWKQVLEVEQIGVYDNFFERGGHSLLATQVISRVREAFQIELALRSLFTDPTVAGLAQAVQAARQVDQEPVPLLQPMARPQRLPLSFAQQRLWFLDQLEPGSPAYNVPAAIRLQGQLDEQALERSLNEVVRRHEILRTTFALVEQQPVQVIAPFLNIALPLVDLRDLDADQRSVVAERVGRQEGQQPFQLERGPLLRVNLLRLQEQEHILLLNMHHIVSDGWSMGVFARELSALYAAFVAGEPSPLPDLPLQYADFALWQRQWLQGEVLDRQLAYWKQHLAGVSHVLDLPTDYPRPGIPSFRGATEPFILSRELSEALVKLSRREGVTLFMTLLAAFQVLLLRYTGQRNPSVGLPIANRTHTSTESLIGFFANQLVLSTDLDGNPTFRELLEREREATLGAYTHQDLPFERLVEEIQPARDFSRNPLFQVAFLLLNTPTSRVQLTDLRLTLLDVSNATTKFDLSLSVQEGDEGLNGLWEYSTDLFEMSTIQRMHTHLQTLLQAIVVDPEQHLTDLPLLPAIERDQMLFGWNATQATYPQDRYLPDLFEDQVASTPDAVAVVFEGQFVSYQELNDLSNRLANYLQKLGVGSETPVGICMERSLEMAIALLGVLKAGGTYVPLDPGDPQERHIFILQDAQVSILLTQERFLKQRPTAIQLCLDRDWEQVAACSQQTPMRTLYPDHLAYVIYTSGSTGMPKGVMTTQRGICNRLYWAQEVYSLCVQDRTLQKSPLSFDISVEEFFWPWMIGACVTLARPDGHKESSYLVATIIEQQITVLRLVTPMLALFVETEGLEACTTLRLVICGGETLMREVVQRFFARLNIPLYNFYGATEASVDSTFWACDPSDERRLVPVGYPMANVQIYILDVHKQPVPIGVAGEIYIGGLSVARGYIARPALTAERFVPDPYSRTPGGRLYKTGDQGRYLPDGNIEFLGRLDAQVKLRGYRIELGEIEAVLSEQPEVRECVVVVREDAPGEKRLVAYLVLNASQDDKLNDLRQRVQNRLPSYMIPARFVVMEALPLTVNGKVDRRVLPVPDDTRPELGTEFVGSRSPVEEVLAGIWCEVLGLQQVGVHDDFFELGGHSLLATQIISRTCEIFQVSVAFRDLFASSTIAGFAVVVDAEIQHGHHVIVPPLSLRRQEDVPLLSFAQQRLWFLDQLEPGSTVYNVPAAIRLQGQLDEQALERSLNEVVRRHEILRTTFALVEQQPVQVIAPFLNIVLPLVDLRGLDAVQQSVVAEQVSRQEGQQPFQLERGSLLRVSLLRLQEQEHILLLNMHHIVSDGWSMGVFARELSALYTAFVAGEPSPLSDLPLQYADFALWQRQWLQGEVLDRQLAYWKQHLAGAPMLQLPTDHPRPVISSFCGATESFIVSRELSEGLVKLSRQQGMTLFMVMLSAFQILLMRYTGQEDIVIGVPLANRTRPEIEPLIGFFVNTLALRIDLTGNPSVREVLRRVRKTTLEAYAHQDLPFERLVEEIQPERTIGQNPLFQVALVLQNAPQVALEAMKLQLTPLATEMVTSKVDLTLLLKETEDGISVVWEYSTDLFEAVTIQRMQKHFQNILANMQFDLDLSCSHLSLLTASESMQQLDEWNATQVDFPPDYYVHQIFEAQVEHAPDAVALVFEDAQLTYGELNSRSNQLAHYLQRLGVGSEICVGICLERSLEMIVAILAVLKAGGAYIPLDPSHPVGRQIYLLEDAHIDVLVTRQVFVKNLSEYVRQIVSLDTDWPLLSDEQAKNLDTQILPSQLAYVIYTSGSTGLPKGVLVTHRNVCNLVCARNTAFKDPATRLFALISMYGDISVLTLFWALCQGGALVLPREHFLQDIQHLIRIADEHYISHMVSVPSLYLHLFPLVESNQLAALRVIIVGGEPCPGDLVEQQRKILPHAQIFNEYGLTETTVWSSVYDCQEWSSPEPVSIGYPVANTKLYILDRYGNLAPVGVAGELCIGGAGLARGYLGLSALTAERFTPDPLSNDVGARLYKTGDLARRRQNGTIEYLGRLDQQVKIRGFRIEPGEIGVVLGRHPAVNECVVVSYEDTVGTVHLVAYAAVDQSHVTMKELRGFLQEQLPGYMVPSIFVLLDMLPHALNGKIDRRLLPVPDINHPELEESYEAPQTPTEELLANIWAQVLLLPRVGRHDNFFELGGDSIIILQIVARTAQAGLQFTPKLLLQHQTIAQLAEVVSTTMTAPVDQEIVPGSVPFTPIQSWFFEQELQEPHHFNQAFLLQFQYPLVYLLFEQAVRYVFQHHDALHLRFLFEESSWQQYHVGIAENLPLPSIDLAALTEQEQDSEIERIGSVLQESLHLQNGPLLRLVIFSLGAQRASRLLFIVHHVVIDGVSWRILIDDVQTAYDQLLQGKIIVLPPKTTSFQKWAEFLTSYSGSNELHQELPYWLEETRVPIAALPVDNPGGANIVACEAYVKRLLTIEETSAFIHKVPLAYQTQSHEVLLTALLQSFARWTGNREFLIDLEGHGREDLVDTISLARTVGWFTSIFPVRLELEAGTTPEAALKAVKEKIRHIPNHGIGYGLLRYLQNEDMTQQLRTCSPAPISFNYLGQFDQIAASSSLFQVTTEPIGLTRSPSGKRYWLLDIVALIVEGQLQINWLYSDQLYHSTTIEGVAEAFMEELRFLIAHCQAAEVGGYTPADFPDSGLSQQELDALMAQIDEDEADL